MKRILIIQGGGRPNGNTSQLVDAFAEGVKDAGHEIEIISLIKNEVKGCLGCNACRYGKPCVQKDCFNDIVPKIMEADLLVFASPLYFWTVSSHIKAFIERFYCIAKEDSNPPLGRYEKYPEKDCALLITAADNFSGLLSRRFHIINLRWSIILDFTIKVCYLQAAVVIQTASRRLIKRTIWSKHINSEMKSINYELLSFNMIVNFLCLLSYFCKFFEKNLYLCVDKSKMIWYNLYVVIYVS